MIDHPKTPLELLAAWWPAARLYEKERQLIEAVRFSTETFCVAGNKLGKDWSLGFIVVSFFWMPWLYFPVSYFQDVERSAERAFRRTGKRLPFHLVHTRRVMTTSVTGDHMDVLWGEISRWISLCKRPLLDLDLTMVHHELRLKAEMAEEGGKLNTNPLNYAKGAVVRQGPGRAGEGLAGHHAAYTLFVADECSGIPEASREAAQGWAQKFVYIGNPNPCPREHFFRKGVEQGDLVA